MHDSRAARVASCGRRTIRTIAAIAGLSLLAAACSDGDEAADTTLPEVTLLATTTTAPVFESEDEPGTETTVVDEVGTTVATTTAAPTTTVVDTTVPETTVAETTTTAPPPASPFTLGSQGIGAAAFGAAPEGVIDFVSSVLGAPSRDTGWIDPFEIGPCGGTELRQVQWGDLVLEFGDFSNVAQERQHFYGYYYGNGVDAGATPPGLTTENTLGVGSTVGDLLAVHPDASLFSGDEFLGPNFQINDALGGTLTGLADNDIVTSFVGGLPCNG